MIWHDGAMVSLKYITPVPPFYMHIIQKYIGFHYYQT